MCVNVQQPSSQSKEYMQEQEQIAHCAMLCVSSYVGDLADIMSVAILT